MQRFHDLQNHGDAGHDDFGAARPVPPATIAAYVRSLERFGAFLARGVNVCIGTDSRASNPDLDVLAEVGELHRRYPDVPGETLLEMATINGAKALGFDDVCGTLEPGKSADLVVVNCEATNDPYTMLESASPRRTMFRGVWR